MINNENGFNPEDLLKAYLYLDKFKEFAKQRMVRLHKEYLSVDCQFFKNRENTNINFVKEYDKEYNLIGFYLNFVYGYGSSGSYEVNKILLSDIATSEEEWESYMKNLKEQQDKDKEAIEIQNQQKSLERRREQYEKLKAEFE